MSTRDQPSRPQRRPFAPVASAFAAGELTPRDELESCLAQLADWEPRIAAFVALDLEAARRAADASTERWRAGRPLSRIDGIPIGIKDIIETAGMPTRMGSPLFADYRPRCDAASVAALREAGAVVVGKTVTTEFAASVPGPTRNPWDPARTPGGSSSGSAAAVGAGVLPAALGTQVIGSIVRPASYCGCVGFKPSVGSINRGGSLDYLSQSCAGVLAATPDDAWLVAREIASRAGGDPGCGGLVGPPDPPPARAPRALAVLETAGWAVATPDAQAQLQRALAALRANGVALLDRRASADVAAVEAALVGAMDLSRRINTWEFRWPLNTFSRDLGHDGLSSLMQARLADANRMTLEAYRELLHERERVRGIYAGLGSSCDAVVTLAAPGAAPLGLASTGDPSFAVPGSLLGVPALALPLLETEALPLGLQLLGFRDRDADLFGVAAWVWEHREGT